MYVGDGVFVVVDLDVLFEFAVFVPVFYFDKVLHKNLVSVFSIE